MNRMCEKTVGQFASNEQPTARPYCVKFSQHSTLAVPQPSRQTAQLHIHMDIMIKKQSLALHPAVTNTTYRHNLHGV
jgi:hypothetical protein